MATVYPKHATGPTPQRAAIPGREKEMGKNDAGGYAFKIEPWTQLRRFLIFGTEEGTYYAGERKHTQGPTAPDPPDGRILGLPGLRGVGARAQV